jgi:REP element-mobilizing transposase RayT
MTTGYRIDHQDQMYFLTFRVVKWVDVFTREIYAQVIIDSLRYCRENKGMRIYAFVIMSNHLHVILSADNNNLSDILRDLKRHSATTILKLIQSEPESRKDWMLSIFQKEANKHKRNIKYQFWHHYNHAIELESSKFTLQKLAYIHLNPVRAGYVLDPTHWKYSSQRNYDRDHTLIDIDLLDF